jgi:hypothetical protein
MEEIKKRILNLNDLSDQKEVQNIKKQIEWFNLNDPKQKEIIDLYYSKYK